MPPLYCHKDGSGRAFWSPVPPAGVDSAASAAATQHRPFYYQPMLVEEAAPVLDRAAASVAHSASVNARMVRVCHVLTC